MNSTIRLASMTVLVIVGSKVMRSHKYGERLQTGVKETLRSIIINS
ncbi:hypothetical protein [Nostoc sp.]